MACSVHGGPEVLEDLWQEKRFFSPGFIICICEIKSLDVFLKNPYLRLVRNIGRACWCKPGLCKSLDLYLRGTSFES